MHTNSLEVTCLNILVSGYGQGQAMSVGVRPDSLLRVKPIPVLHYEEILAQIKRFLNFTETQSEYVIILNNQL